MERGSTSEDSYDLVVLGGGIMGLACAFEEAARGRSVALVDPNPLGRKASWAAAGILVSRAGVVANSPFRDLYLRSLAAYPEWLNRVESESGNPVAYVRGGDYQIFPLDNPASVRSLKARESQLAREKATGFSVQDEWPAFLEPYACKGPVRAFHFPGEAYVNNRELLAALEIALRRHGADLFPDFRITSFSTGSDNILEGAGRKLRAKQVLITAGAWCNEILKLVGWRAPVIPVKGQLASFPAFHAEKSMIHFQEKLYLIPRGNNLIAGATTEPEIWDEDFNSAGDEKLRGHLREFFPGIKPEWMETWAGIRPRARDRLPLMGWIDENAGIALCTGHYKSGIGLAPLAAKFMSALLNGEKPPVTLEPFNPHRKGGLTPSPFG